MIKLLLFRHRWSNIYDLENSGTWHISSSHGEDAWVGTSYTLLAVLDEWLAVPHPYTWAQ